MANVLVNTRAEACLCFEAFQVLGGVAQLVRAESFIIRIEPNYPDTS